MSKQGPALMKCPCGYDKWRTTTEVNILRCFKCGRDQGITKTMRFQGQNANERAWDEQNEQSFTAIKKASEK